MDKEIKQFFKLEKDKVIFIGDELEIFIPERYKNFSCLKIADKVNTLATFEMVVTNNGKTYKSGYFLPRIINIIPTNIELITKDDTKFVKLTLKPGNVFIESVELIKVSSLAWVIFYEYVNASNTPPFITYDDKAFIFDNVMKNTGVKFRVDHAIFEIIFAHLNRDFSNINLQYRLTDMKSPSLQIPLNDVSHASISTTSRLMGSYFSNGITASLVEDNFTSSVIEDILRM